MNLYKNFRRDPSISNYNFCLIYSTTVITENKLNNHRKNSNEIINQFLLFYKSALYG